MKISLFLLSLFAALIALVVSAPTPGNAPSTPTVDKEQKWMKFNDPSIHKAVRDGDIRKVKEYIADNEKNLNLANAYGNTPLHIAVKFHQIDLIDILLRERNIETNLQNTHGQTPFFVSIMCNYFGIASKLIEKHVDVNIKDRSGSTPLINAVREENIKAVRYLVTDAHEDINLRDKSSGATALSIAVVKDEFDISDFLITVGKADVNLARFDGVYPLHLAVGNNNLMLVQLLLGAGAKVDVRDKNDKTTLDYAIAGGHYKIECLLRSAMQQEGYGTTNIDTEVNSSAFVG